MSNVREVYYMAPSCEIGRPQVDLLQHDLNWDDWGDMKQSFPREIDTVLSPPSLYFHIENSDAISWDWFDVSLWGMWSQRAKDLLWPYTNGCLRCFKTSLNGAPYYILRVDSELATDCLDRERSDIQYFESSGRVMQVKKFVFHRERSTDPLIFHVPEIPDILCTQSVKSIVEEAGLKGFSFQDVEHLDR